VQISDRDSAAEPGSRAEHPAASHRPIRTAALRRGARQASTPGPSEKPAGTEQPIIGRLLPAWQPARGVSQAAVTLAAVLILMLLVGGITSLLRRGVFFFRQREWKHPPPRIRAWKLGPEGMELRDEPGCPLGERAAPYLD
jgi:hypothetical protein